jgi:hypothetical protein
LSKTTPREVNDNPLRHRNGRIAYFTTESSVGFRLTWGETPVPDSVHLGYKRKEFSLIPIGTMNTGQCTDKVDTNAKAENKTVDCYGSVLAHIDLGGAIKDRQGTALQISQFFATGLAAEYAAAENTDVRKLFEQDLLNSNLVANYACESDCMKISKFLATMDGEKSVRDKCLTPKKIARTFDLLYFSEYQAARQECVSTLKL